MTKREGGEKRRENMEGENITGRKNQKNSREGNKQTTEKEIQTKHLEGSEREWEYAQKKGFNGN